MADRPVLFSGPMVRALLAGTKTQTRRIAKITAVMGNKAAVTSPEESLIELEPGEFRRGVMHYLSTGALSGPYDLPYKVGDRLWVRETWTARMTHGWTIAQARSGLYRTEIIYQADGVRGDGWWPCDETDYRWWPSIHMPREFSRLTLIVTDVRVQRIQDISEADARAEGIVEMRKEIGGAKVVDGELVRLPNRFAIVYALDAYDDDWCEESAVDRYRYLWDSLNAKRGFGWNTNPWVVAITFNVHQHNIDDVRGGA